MYKHSMSETLLTREVFSGEALPLTWATVRLLPKWIISFLKSGATVLVRHDLPKRQLGLTRPYLKGQIRLISNRSLRKRGVSFTIRATDAFGRVRVASVVE